VAVVGGAVVPVGATGDSHRVGAVAVTRVAYTSELGVGAEVSAAYAPLPRHTEAGVRTASHYGLITAGPLFTTFWWSQWRLTAVADAGVAIESVRSRVASMDASQRSVLPVVGGGLRLGLRLGNRGALTVGGGFHQHFGSGSYSLVDIVAGITLTF
jgi:hypothetical protein